MTEEAFAALGNEHRLEVLRVVAEAVEADEDGLSFTSIYDRIDTPSTSQLSYHLDQLSGRFLQQRGEQYTLTTAGERVVRSIRSGLLTESPSFEPTVVEGRCPNCEGTTLRATHADRLLTVACTGCETTVVTYDLPPAEPLDREPLDTLRSCNRRALRDYGAAIEGTCPTCSGTTAVEVESGPDGDHVCIASCGTCHLRLFAPAELPLFFHPAVISFYWDRGVDVTDLPLWRLTEFVGDAESHVREEPFELEITLTRDGDCVTATVDADGTVSTPAGSRTFE